MVRTHAKRVHAVRDSVPTCTAHRRQHFTWLRLGSLDCERRALLHGPSTSALEVAMEQSGSSPSLTARVRRLQLYRLLANSYPVLLALAFVVVAFRWMFPWLFSVLVFIWTVDAFLLVVLAVPWLIVRWALALGKIKCPSCGAPFATKFHLWAPKTCQTCRYDITAPHKGPTSDNHSGA